MKNNCPGCGLSTGRHKVYGDLVCEYASERSQLFDSVTGKVTTWPAGDDDEEEDEEYENEEYENEDCPNLCSEDHAVLTDGTAWRCMAEGDWFFTCTQCGDNESTDRYGSDNRTNVGDRYDPAWVCGTCRDASYFFCNGHDEWVHDDNYGGDGYCESCYESEDEHEGGPSKPGQDVTTAPCCSTPNVHMDLLTEEFLCYCRAQAAKASKRPVLMAVAA